MFRKLFVLLLTLLMIGCGFSTEKRRPKAIEETQSERSVRKISEADILNKVKKLGDSISMQAQQLFMKRISEQYAKGGFVEAAAYCNMEAYSITDSLAKSYSIYLKRVSTQNRSPQNAPSEMEKELLEAYEYSHQEGIDLNPNVQFIQPGDTILYNKPIFIASELCLNCHGTKDDISEEVQALLKERYPNDQATGYELGDFRGMWSLKFLKKDIVKNL
ncbi:DUF3365 domain-containing protein [Marivirga sp. S37H4]|uniref:DUF3365 domain-containing protein n=1 Tax=Marivirga aurantiaca TaxID=2802615 RepID=A0A934X2K1_9BACT|nr:DUF3365 domain-containing protein [Marivirga aurantiaca]MBK6267121.1 DUF3365 domain-containing protein [Marivirga aurantiaca]